MLKTQTIFALFIAALVIALLAPYVMPPRETFVEKPVGAPVQAAPMGPYDAVGSGGGAPAGTSNEDMSSMPASTPAQPYIVQDDQLHLQQTSFKPSCCPSSISNDQGCACLTKDQENQITYRGGNRSTSSLL